MTDPLRDQQGQDREAGGLSHADLVAAWLAAMEEAYREPQRAEAAWEDDWVWCCGPGPGYDDGPETDADQTGVRDDRP